MRIIHQQPATFTLYSEEDEECQKQRSSSNSRELATDRTMNSIDTEAFRSGVGGPADANFNAEVGMENLNLGKKLSEYSEHNEDVSFPVQGAPSAVASDPSMRQAYVMPAVGRTVPQHLDQSPSRQYKMASDIFGTGMDKSWTGSPESGKPVPKNISHGLIPGAQSPLSTVPGSFKITENFPNTTIGMDDLAANTPAGRRARESSGNPLTGQGFDPENTKTGKRYFEGSNANQKLW